MGTKNKKCKSLLRLLLVKPSLLMLNQQTLSKTSRPRSRTRKVLLQISKDSSSLVSNLRMEEPFQTTTSRKNLHSILCSDSEEVCRSSSKLSLVRPSPLMLSQLTLLRTLRPRSKTRKVSHQISKDLSSLESNLRMEELFQTIIFKKNQPFTWSLDLEEVNEYTIKQPKADVY